MGVGDCPDKIHPVEKSSTGLFFEIMKQGVAMNIFIVFPTVLFIISAVLMTLLNIFAR